MASPMKRERAHGLPKERESNRKGAAGLLHLAYSVLHREFPKCAVEVLKGLWNCLDFPRLRTGVIDALWHLRAAERLVTDNFHKSIRNVGLSF